jgi:hypothetical protein
MTLNVCAVNSIGTAPLYESREGGGGEGKILPP